ncbi:MAG: AMIN domain-containing protein, partial [Alphaproteobacteria bacterium]
MKILEADLRAQDAAAANDARTTGALGVAAPVPVSPGTAPGANGAAITSSRLGDHGAQTRFGMEFAGEAGADYRGFTVSGPSRVGVEKKGGPGYMVDEPAVKGKGFVSGYRYGRFEADTWRVVIDADQPVEVARDFVLDPQSGFGR